jgi:murein DD-endopeptidase MepM/ murein hydrolase activator NlpD
MKERRTLYERLTKRYLLIIHREDNLKEEVTINFTFAKMVVALFVIFLVLLIMSILVGRGLEAALARKEDALTINKQIVRLSVKVDSLEVALQMRDKFIEDFKTIMNGGKPVILEQPNASSNVSATNVVKEIENKNKPIDSAFRHEFEVTDRTSVAYSKDDLKDVKLLSPLKGLALKKYDYTKKHYGIDIVAQKNEPIKAVADGTVLLASWTQDSGYVIAIQHDNNLVSFYKHNSTLLKKVGESVKMGEKVAIIGNSGELTDGPHLHFELWHKGIPINPEDFMNL